MNTIEIFAYFAAKNMGSKLLQTIDVVWEKIDEIEKQMVSSIRRAKAGNLIIKSNLTQHELDKEVEETPYIIL